MMRCRCVAATVCLLICSIVATAQQRPPRFASHPPVRPLPEASRRPPPDGTLRSVDAARGDDQAEGSRERPWRTLPHAIARLQPRDTLYLRGGTYYETVTLSLRGTAEKPITIRSFPGELAVID